MGVNYVPAARLLHTLLAAALAAAVLGSAVVDPPPVPQYANLTTTSIFWPNETAADGTVFACTYLPTMVLANGTRLIVHGRCYTQRQAAMSRVCGGFHVSAAASFSLAAARSTPLGPINLCQKHSDTGGLHWSRIRSVGTGLTTGQVLWDRVGEVLIAQNSEVDTSGMFTLRTVERRSYDLGQSWVQARDVSHLLPGNVTQVVAALGGALQLSSNNRYHPGRMIWNGVGTHGNITNRALVWYSDDGGKTFQFSRDANTGSIFLPEGIGEESALAETPDGGIFLSSRNVLYHGKSRCNCRASVRFARGGDTFGGVFPSPELVEPECEATMLGPVDDSAGAMFHANPGHGTDTENKSPPDGRASGTVRRSVDGGRTWEASLVLNGHGAYSYSCLSQVPQPGLIGLAWETVLPGTHNSYLRPKASANNILFTLIPQNFTNATALHVSALSHHGHESLPWNKLRMDDSLHNDAHNTLSLPLSPAVSCPVRPDGTVYVDECGDGFNARDAAGQPDHTAVIQAALRSPAHTVVLRNLSASTPWITQPLFLVNNNSLLRFERHAFLHAKRGRDCRKAGQETCFHGRDDSMITVVATHNVSIIGDVGATIRMWKQDYLNFTEYAKAEWRMGIYLGHELDDETAFSSCQDMAIQGPLSIEQTGGDGIYVDQCVRVHIRDVRADGNYRQGMSIIGAKHMLVERCNFSNTNGTAPAAGVDIEPDGVHYDLENLTIRDCFAVNNSGHGIQGWLNSGQANNVSVLIERYTVVGSPMHPRSGGFVFGRLHPPGGEIRIRDSSASATAFDGIYVWDELLDNNGPGWDFHLVFENVELRATATDVGALSYYSNQPGFAPQIVAPIGLDSLAAYGDSGLQLINVTVYDSIKRPFLQANSKWGAHSIVGTARVVKPLSQPSMDCSINASSHLQQPFPDLTVECATQHD